MLVYGFEAAPNLHSRYAVLSVRSALHRVVRLTAERYLRTGVC